MAAPGERPLEPAKRSELASEVREEVKGIVRATHHAVTDAEWAELGKRFGAMQRRARMIAGQGKGG